MHPTLALKDETSTCFLFTRKNERTIINLRVMVYLKIKLHKPDVL